METTTRKDYRQEYRADIGDREIYATVKRYGGGYNDGQTDLEGDHQTMKTDLIGTDLTMHHSFIAQQRAEQRAATIRALLMAGLVVGMFLFGWLVGYLTK